MALIFSYGTLQEEHVQLATFGRLLHGRHDELPGFELSLVTIVHPGGTTQYANVKHNGDRDSRVRGVAFEITDAELAAADDYERRASYTRITVTLASGRQACLWVHDA